MKRLELIRSIILNVNVVNYSTEFKGYYNLEATTSKNTYRKYKLFLRNQINGLQEENLLKAILYPNS